MRSTAGTRITYEVCCCAVGKDCERYARGACEKCADREVVLETLNLERDWWSQEGTFVPESSRTGQRTDGWSEEDLTDRPRDVCARCGLERRCHDGFDLRACDRFVPQSSRPEDRDRSDRPASPDSPTSLIERPPVMVSEVLPLEDPE